MNLARMNKILEIFWWVMAVATLILVFAMHMIDGWDKWGIYYALPVICVILAIVRRFMSKKLEKSQAFGDKNS